MRGCSVSVTYCTDGDDEDDDESMDVNLLLVVPWALSAALQSSSSSLECSSWQLHSAPPAGPEE